MECPWHSDEGGDRQPALVARAQVKFIFSESEAAISIGGFLSAALERSSFFLFEFSRITFRTCTLALATRILYPRLRVILRPFICVVGAVSDAVLRIVGVDHFASWLATLFALLGYRFVIHCTILIEECSVISCRGDWANYEPDRIPGQRYLPVGTAAFLAA